MDFGLFILVTAILFIRPADFVPGLEFNLYVIVLVPCLILSWHKIIPQLTSVGLRERPVLVFGIGIVLVSVISNVVYGRYQMAFDFATELSKVLIFYVLMLAQLDSYRRLRFFVGCLAGIILVPICLALLNHHQIVNIPAFNAMKDSGGFDARTGDIVMIDRLRATGNFGDPNDVCELINCALIFSLYGLLDRGRGMTRVIWLAPLALFGHALGLTQSRGGFLATMVGLMVLFRSRFRGVKWLIIAGLTLALMLTFLGDRQTSLSTSEGTGAGRIQLWNAAFGLFVRSPVSPLIGIGIGGFAEHTGHAAHNAFVQTYAELGFLGGTLLFGQYFWCLTNLAKLGSKQFILADPGLRRLQPFMLAALASFATSEMSLTNPEAVVTYAMFGVATAFIRLADAGPTLPDLPLSRTLVRKISLFSCLFLLALYLFVKLNVQ